MKRCWFVMFLVGCGHIGIDPLHDDAALGAPSNRRWTITQTAGVSSPPTSAVTLTVDPLGANHLIVVAMELGPRGAVSIQDNSIDGGNTYTAISMARAMEATTMYELRMFYAKDSRPGATEIRLTGTNVAGAVMWPELRATR